MQDTSQRGELLAKIKTRIRLSIVLGSGAQIGPDKVALLESIRDTGSISAAARNTGLISGVRICSNAIGASWALLRTARDRGPRSGRSIDPKV